MPALRPDFRAFAAGLFLLAATGAAGATPALVVDADSRAVLHAEDAGHPWYPASTTKLMTAYVVFEALRDGEVTLETPVVLSRYAMKQTSLHAGLKVGSAMRLQDALYAMLVGSANEVAIGVADAVAGSELGFVDRMNAAAERLGMSASHFANPNGLFDPDQHASARDLAILGLAIDREFPQYAPIFRTGRVLVDGRALDSYNTLLTRFAGTTGMKTGFLCDSGRNIVALAERDGRRVMVVLLGATTERERAERAAKFMTEAFAGTLEPTGLTLESLENDEERAPKNLRARLCTERAAAAYEAERDRLYPMGLPGEESYLGEEQTLESYAFQTWQASTEPAIPRPTFRPLPLDEVTQELR